MKLFKSLQFEYVYGRKSPSGYNYLRAKDSVKWVGLKPKDYIPLISSMFNKYCSNLDL